MRKAIWLCLGDVVRESEVRMMNARNAKREMLVLNQWEFLETRQRALELVIGGLSIWDRIAILMGQKSLKEAIDAVHLVLYKAAQKEREEMTRKAKVEARKPRLIVPNGNGGIHV